MKPVLQIAVCILYSWLILNSCKKELSCENCLETNKPPIADAGRDTLIVLPADSIYLDGSASKDVDGSITTYQWKSISGPTSITIINSSKKISQAEKLKVGNYSFELIVTDNGGLSDKDTIIITVNDAPLLNKPPVANAGQDFSIALPLNIASLDGSISSDPDNNIVSYSWSKIAGPPSFSFANSSAVLTEAIYLLEGIYLFELKVTDAGGLFSKDTVQVKVNAATIAVCGDSNRTHVNARLIPVGALSKPGTSMSVGTAGTKIVFAGRNIDSRVDIYDIVTQTWSTAELSVGRYAITIVSAGNKIFFGGGETGDGTSPVNTVDIYDVSTNTWSTSKLSTAGHSMAGATVGNKLFFAGGDGGFTGAGRSHKVDIYDLATNTWSNTTLSENKELVTAVAANNKIYFAGGATFWIDPGNGNYSPGISRSIDIYDNATNLWSASTLQESKASYAAINVSNKIYWAGGIDTYERGQSCSVEIRDVITGITSIQYLSKPGEWSANTGRNAVVKDNKIIFLRTGDMNNNEFDIYDIASNSWSIGVLPFNIQRASIISVNNVIYIAGGLINGVESNKVWTLEF